MLRVTSSDTNSKFMCAAFHPL